MPFLDYFVILSLRMSGTYLSPSLNFYKHARSNNNGCVSADLGSVSVSEVGILFLLLSALLAGLLLQHTLHPYFCFASWNRSDPSVLVAGKSRSRTKKQLLKTWNLFCHLHYCYLTQGRKHSLPLLLLKQVIGSTSTCPLTTPIPRATPTSLIIVGFFL